MSEEQTTVETENENTEIFKVPQYLIDAKRNAINDCRILYCGTKKPPTQSLMCFGWECGDGWNREIADLSYRLEAMNILLYPKYRTRIEAMQIKEKFGYFRGYFNVVIDPPVIRGFPTRMLGKLHDFLANGVNYRYEHVTDVLPHDSEEWNAISKEDFDRKVVPEYVSNQFGWKFKEEGGKYYRNSCVYHPEQWHRRPTKHLLLHWLKDFSWKLKCMTDCIFSRDTTKEQKVIAAFMDSYMEQCVSETERKCHNTCEYCGNQIGNRYYGRCQTQGWIQYICEDCAKRRNLEYINQKGELCNPDGSVKMTKDEFKKFQCERFKAKPEDFDDDNEDDAGDSND